jgi:hypothetical protein
MCINYLKPNSRKSLWDGRVVKLHCHLTIWLRRLAAQEIWHVKKHVHLEHQPIWLSSRLGSCSLVVWTIFPTLPVMR